MILHLGISNFIIGLVLVVIAAISLFAIEKHRDCADSTVTGPGRAVPVKCPNCGALKPMKAQVIAANPT
jgi:hypothetical protein